MRKLFQGIAFILFGILLVLISIPVPNIFRGGENMQVILLLLALIMGVIGLALGLSKDKSGG